MPAAFLAFAQSAQDAVEGADRTMVAALVKQGGIDFGRGLVGKARLMQQVAHYLAFSRRECAGRAGTRAAWQRRVLQVGPVAEQA